MRILKPCGLSDSVFILFVQKKELKNIRFLSVLNVLTYKGKRKNDVGCLVFVFV